MCFHDLRLMRDAHRAGAAFGGILTIEWQSLCLHPIELGRESERVGRNQDGSGNERPR